MDPMGYKTSSFPIVFSKQKALNPVPHRAAEIKFRQSTEDAWRGSMKGVASAARAEASGIAGGGDDHVTLW
jgi:hypothetical protein